MSFDCDDLLARLERFETAANRPLRYIVAFSGGLDSSVLLHALARCRARHAKALLAVHVDHRLQPQSADWARHCERFAKTLDVDVRTCVVDVEAGSGRGPEAAARDARYAAFDALVTATDWLLSAHHADDQSETLLLNLLRGSGPAGVAGIPELRPFGAGWLARPLLHVPRDSLLDYATAHGLEWVHDPSNEATYHDRNFLRNRVLPRLADRWPQVASRLARSAELAREAAGLLDDLADIDLASLGVRADRIDVPALRRLSPARQKNLLRRACTRNGLPQAPGPQLESIVKDLLPARRDASPLVRWDGAEARRFRDRLYLLVAVAEPEFSGVCLGEQPVRLGPGLGSLVLARGEGPGLSAACVQTGLTLKTRTGGEKIKPFGHRHTRKLKKLLQEAGIVPWMRDKLPLVYSGERLVAVGDLWLEAAAAEPGGLAVRWCDRPAID